MCRILYWWIIMPLGAIPLSYILCDLFNVSFVVQYLYFVLKSSLLAGFFVLFCCFVLFCSWMSVHLIFAKHALTRTRIVSYETFSSWFDHTDNIWLPVLIVDWMASNSWVTIVINDIPTQSNITMYFFCLIGYSFRPLRPSSGQYCVKILKKVGYI